MAAASIDKFKRTSNQTATTLSAPGHTSGGTTITVGSTSRWPTTTGVVFAIDMVTLNGTEEVQVPNSYTLWNGVVTSATTIGSMVLSDESPNSDQDYPAGSLTRVYMPVSAGLHNDLVEGILLHANQDGSLITSAVQTALGLGSTPTAGWSPMAQTITAVTNNGNRSETLTFSASVASVLSPGMRLQTQRTVAAPTQCTSLNGTTQYYSKSSPAGMTFTDDFVAGAWVKLNAYPASVMAIESRYNGTSGWIFGIDSTGRAYMNGYNGAAANYKGVVSYQSIPLNKWVYVAIELDMNTGTTTSTTNYIMIDSVDVPCSITQGGTNPTSLIQAGNYEIGVFNAGLAPFNGKIAQAFVSSAKITQANVRTLMSQGLTPALISANNIISAYSFDNAITDLNTTSANNLTANGAPSYAVADSPFGGQGDGTISSTLDYGIVQAVSASTVTVQVAEGCTIPTSGGVSAVSYSTQKVPYNFPSFRGKWRVEVLSASQWSAANGAGQYANPSGAAKITIPIGSWMAGYDLQMQLNPSVAAACEVRASMTTSSGNFSDIAFTTAGGIGATTASTSAPAKRERPISLTSETAYYVNIFGSNAGNVYIRGDNGGCWIYAENAYL